MVKLTKKTIKPGQVVKVIDAVYKLPTMKNSSWYQPQAKLTAYVNIGVLTTPSCELDTGEYLEIIDLVKDVRGVTYKREKDGKIYSSYLGEFTTFTRLI
jgi:hypothetical protein